MYVEVKADGSIKWTFYRKAYKKSRWKKVGKRQVDFLMSAYPGFTGGIIVI